MNTLVVLSGCQWYSQITTGSIKDGMLALSRYAFNGDTSNYDPIIIVLYLRRGRKETEEYILHGNRRSIKSVII